MAATRQAASPVAGAAALDKAFALVDRIGEAASPPTAAELGAATGLPRSTLFRLLAALEAQGYVRRDERDRGWRLGFRLFELAQIAWSDFDLRDAALGELGRLPEATGETALLAVLDQGACLIVGGADGTQAIRHTSAPGQRTGWSDSAPGLALVAFADAGVRDALIEALPARERDAARADHRTRARPRLRRGHRRDRGRRGDRRADPRHPRRGRRGARARRALVPPRRPAAARTRAAADGDRAPRLAQRRRHRDLARAGRAPRSAVARRARRRRRERAAGRGAGLVGARRRAVVDRHARAGAASARSGHGRFVADRAPAARERRDSVQARRPAARATERPASLRSRDRQAGGVRASGGRPPRPSLQRRQVRSARTASRRHARPRRPAESRQPVARRSGRIVDAPRHRLHRRQRSRLRA